MKAFLIAFCVIALVLPLQAGVNPALFEKFHNWLENRPDWTQTVTYDQQKHAFTFTVATYTDDFAAMAVEPIETVNGDKMLWLVWSPAGAFLFVEGEPPIWVANPQP
jgi:hypothetical protein